MGIFMPIAFSLFGIVFAVIGIKTENLIPTGFGIVFVAAAVFLLYQIIREKKMRKLYEEDPEAYNAMIEAEEEENPEAEAYEQEMEEIEEYDSDSGKGYCSFCGNYAVNSQKICESCGEKAID